MRRKRRRVPLKEKRKRKRDMRDDLTRMRLLCFLCAATIVHLHRSGGVNVHREKRKEKKRKRKGRWRRWSSDSLSSSARVVAVLSSIFLEHAAKRERPACCCCCCAQARPMLCAFLMPNYTLDLPSAHIPPSPPTLLYTALAHCIYLFYFILFYFI